MSEFSKQFVRGPLTYRVSAFPPRQGYTWTVEVAVFADCRADPDDTRYYDPYDYPGSPHCDPLPGVTTRMQAFPSAYTMLRPAGQILSDWMLLERPASIAFLFGDTRLFRILHWYAKKLIRRHSMPYKVDVRDTLFSAKRMRKREYR